MSEIHAVFSLQREPWKERAACIGADPRIFVLDQGVTPVEAKQYCMRCEVRDECADYARRTGSVGVFGGKLFTFRYADPVELMPIRTLQDARPKPLYRQQDPGSMPSIMGRVASFSRPSILGR